MTTLFSYVLSTEHDYPAHPENAARGAVTLAKVERDPIARDLYFMPAKEAELSQIRRAHAQAVIDRVYQFAMRGGGRIDQDTYVTDSSYESALYAAGTVTQAAAEIASGNAANGYVFVRPPGHHAEYDRSMGFCLFNNVAVAARALQQEQGLGKVMIIDIDVHHGNGTQDIFYEDESVLFVSLHQFGHYFYPGTGSLQEVGRNKGKGFNLNVPLMDGVGDAGYLEIVSKIVVPAGIRFSPDFIIVSAGFDAHWMDPLSSMGLSLNGYAKISQVLKDMANQISSGRILFVQEGGYDLNVLSGGALNTLYALGNYDKIADPLGKNNEGEPDVGKIVDEIRRVHLIN